MQGATFSKVQENSARKEEQGVHVQGDSSTPNIDPEFEKIVCNEKES